MSSPISVHLRLACRESCVAAGHRDMVRQPSWGEAGREVSCQGLPHWWPCHCKGSHRPLREELMAFLGGSLVFLRAGSGESQAGGNPSSGQDGVPGTLLGASSCGMGERRGPGGGQCSQGASRLPRASIGAWRRALQCPGFHLPSCCLELGSPAHPSETVLPCLSLQLVADPTSSRSGNAAHLTVPSCGTSVFEVILFFLFSLLVWEGTR